MTVRKHISSRVAAALMVLALAGCGGGSGGGGGGGGGGGDSAPPPPLPAMVDSLGRPVAEADFGAGDAAAAGADGTAFDLGPMANAEVTVTDAAGTSRAAVTDSSGYYRISIKDLTPPFVAKVKRADAGQWMSASAASVRPRGFVTMNLNGLTDKAVGYVADAASIAGGAASAVTPAVLVANPAALDAAKARIRTGLAAPLSTAGLDPASYDPVTTALPGGDLDRHAMFLQGLQFYRGAQGRTGVAATLAGAASAVFREPQGLAVDTQGNVLVADEWNHVIRKISPAGAVSTLAGTGVPGFTNGGRATATFNRPVAVAADAKGNMYVAEEGNHAVRKISASGAVTTVLLDAPDASLWSYRAGSLATDAAGNLFVADTRSVRKLTPDGVVSTVASRPAQPCCSSAVPGDIFAPLAVATDPAGNVYVAGGRGGVIVKITPAGTRSELPAPAPLAMFTAIVADSSGTVYATEFFERNAVWRMKADGSASVFAGETSAGSADGAGTAARFKSLSGIARDPGGNLVVADQGNRTIRRVTPAGEVTTIAGRRTGFSDGAGASFGSIGALAAAQDGSTLVADIANHAIRKISATGTVTTLAGTGAAGFANGNGRAASFNGPTDVAADDNGNIYVADSGNHVIRKVTATGEVSTFAGTGVAGVADGQRGAATFTSPGSVAVGTGGDVFVADAGGLRRISAGGIVSTVVSRQGNGLELSSFIAAHPGGPVYFHATADCCDALGHYSEALFSYSPDAGLRQLTGTFFAARGPGVDRAGNAYYARDQRVFRLTPAGVETELLSLDFIGFNGFRADPGGNLLVADDANVVVKVVLP